MRGTLCLLGCAVLLLCLLAFAGPARGFVGVSVSVAPDSAVVAPDSFFNLTVRVDSIGTPCSGFENTLAWDGALLEYISYQPEDLLNQLAWSEWQSPGLYPDSTHIYIVIYPFQGFLDEPGPLYSFTFRARAPGITPVAFSLARFGSAQSGGISPVLIQGGLVFVTDPGSTLEPGPDQGLIDLRAVPNPLSPGGVIQWKAPSSWPVRLEAFDVFGRRLAFRRLPAGMAGSEGLPSWSSIPARELFAGRRTGGEVVYVRLEVGAHTRRTRIVLTH